MQVDSLKSKHSLEEVRDTMQPQLQRLMYILQVRRRANGHNHLFWISEAEISSRLSWVDHVQSTMLSTDTPVA